MIKIIAGGQTQEPFLSIDFKSQELKWGVIIISDIILANKPYKKSNHKCYVGS